MSADSENLSDTEMAEIEAKIDALNKQWEEGLLKFEKAMGLSHKEMKKKLEDPSSFSKEEWAQIEKERQACYEEMEKVLGKEALKRYKEEIAIASKKKLHKGGSAKTGRPKWIPIR